MKRRNTNKYGHIWSLETRVAVWQRAQKIASVNPNFVRLDAYGAVIEWKMFDKSSPEKTGWIIEHIIPISEGGTDRLDNLQAVQWHCDDVEIHGDKIAHINGTK